MTGTPTGTGIQAVQQRQRVQEFKQHLQTMTTPMSIQIQMALTDDGNANAYGNSRMTRMTVFMAIQAIQGRGAHFVGTGALLQPTIGGTGANGRAHIGGTGANGRAHIGGTGADGHAHVGGKGADGCAHVGGMGAIPHANVGGMGAIPHANVGGMGAIPRANVGGTGAN
jgi:hypothetical protein